MRKNSKADYLIITPIRRLHIWHDFSTDVLSIMQNKNTKDTNILHLSALNQTDRMQETRTQTAQVINKRLDAKLHQNSKQSDKIGNTTMMSLAQA